MTEVVAALIWDNDKFMICQRPANKARPLLWEFVGGKVEPGETKEQALIRECKEELDIILEVGEVFTEAVHEYPDITIRLTVFNAKIAEGVPILIEHNDLKWITPDEIPQYEFCPADVEVLKKLVGKCVLVDNDMSFEGIKDTSFLKILVTAETCISVEKKMFRLFRQSTARGRLYSQTAIRTLFMIRRMAGTDDLSFLTQSLFHLTESLTAIFRKSLSQSLTEFSSGRLKD